MSGQEINIKTDDGKEGFTGYLAVPESGKGPGIILIQEIFGVNSHIRQVAELYAQAGFTVLAPDVFWRVQPNVQLGYTPDDMKKAMELAGKADPDQGLADMKSAIKTLRERKECGTKVGAIGYCMGGSYAYRLATADAVDVGIGYYGGQIQKYLGEAKNLHCPLMLHFGAKDKHISQEVVGEIKNALKDKGHVEVFVYDADHGFNCDQRASYDRQSAMLAYGRTMVLLSKTLT